MSLLSVIADDLTGALDTGVKFCGQGRTVSVRSVRAAPVAADVPVVDTDTRALPPTEAAALVSQCGRTLLPPLYKKVDSTLRGPFAAECLALVEVLGMAGVVLAPAAPSVGRTVRSGRLYVRDRPPAEAGFGYDVHSPLGIGDIAALVASQVAAPVTFVALAALRQGPAAVAEKLADSDGFVVADAETDGDLLVLARALELAPSWLPAGSAGLAQAIATARGWQPDAARLAAGDRPDVVICGSANEVSRVQIAKLCRSLGTQPVLPAGRTRTMDELAAQRERCGVAIGALPERAMAPGDAAASLDALVGAAADLVRHSAIRSLFVTGGETLRRLCQQLDIGYLSPEGELEPGVVLSCGVTADGHRLRFVSRAGGFGDEELLLRLLLWGEPGEC